MTNKSRADLDDENYELKQKIKLLQAKINKNLISLLSS